jgi:hypothetical protein
VKYLLRFMLFVSSLLASVPAAFADWVPLIDASAFDGIRTDVMTLSAGVISVVLILIGLAYLVKAMVR